MNDEEYLQGIAELSPPITEVPPTPDETAEVQETVQAADKAAQQQEETQTQKEANFNPFTADFC